MTLNDIAPWPATAAEATAEKVLKHLTVCAAAQQEEARRLCTDAFKPGADPAGLTRYIESFEVLGYRFITVYLLRIFAEVAPERADGLARELWSLMRDTEMIPELLWDWLSEYGIDPEQVAALAKDEKEARAA